MPGSPGMAVLLLKKNRNILYISLFFRYNDPV